ncbi:DNA replication/repair protein RecF [Chloroflexota bacterium]
MHIEHLSLTNFRNYGRLELDLPQHVAVLRGDNAQGKTSLLEAIYMVATTRPPRAIAERELINWLAYREEMPVARLLARVQRGRGKIEVELGLQGPRGEPLRAAEGQPSPPGQVHKRIRVNGITRRAIDLIGQVNVVLFGAQDIEVISGAPSLRRRYLDLAHSQVDSHYLRALQHYQRVLEQRNHLLRSIQERRARPVQLDFWDGELVGSGSQLVTARHHLVAALNPLAHSIHQEITVRQESLEIVYRPSIGREAAAQSREPERVAEAFQQALRRVREKEIASGMTLVGPHRDDIGFLANRVDMGIYGSRGQQRAIALSLRLAEARFMLEKTGDHPILLLDDVLSELDSQRRGGLLQSAAAYQQVLLTTTDLDPFPPELLAEAALFELREGSVQRLH